jgi:hypothetical protein
LQRKKHNGKETQICPLQNLFAWITEWISSARKCLYRSLRTCV